jgi:hypothetical protein
VGHRRGIWTTLRVYREEQHFHRWSDRPAAGIEQAVSRSAAGYQAMQSHLEAVVRQTSRRNLGGANFTGSGAMTVLQVLRSGLILAALGSPPAPGEGGQELDQGTDGYTGPRKLAR